MTFSFPSPTLQDISVVGQMTSKTSDTIDYTLTAIAVDVAADINNRLTALSANPGGGRVRLSGGKGFVSSSIVIPANCSVAGRGRGATEISANGNFPVVILQGNVGATTPLLKAGVLDMTIRGGGNASSNADGVRADYTNRCYIHNVQFYSCQNAIRSSNAWMMEIDKVRIDGAGTDGSINGIYLLENYNATINSYDNNAHIVTNTVIQGYGTFISGVRIENGTGSLFQNVQSMGCQYGWYVGDQPGGHSPIQFMFFNQCQGDTSSSAGWVFSKGTSSFMSYIYMTDIWSGLSGPSDVHGGFYIVGGTQMEITGLKGAGNSYGAVISGCSRIRMHQINIHNYDRAGAGACAVLFDNTTKSSLTQGSFPNSGGVAGTHSVVSNNGSNLNVFENITADKAILIADASSKTLNIEVNGAWVA